MHSLIITSLTGILLLLPVLGIQLPMSQVALALAIAVAFVGLPHGGLDHRVGKKVLALALANFINLRLFLQLPNWLPCWLWPDGSCLRC